MMLLVRTGCWRNTPNLIIINTAVSDFAKTDDDAFYYSRLAREDVFSEVDFTFLKKLRTL